MLALGNFDGLHRGHMKIIERVHRSATERAATPVVLTFDPHPTRVLRPEKAPRVLMTEAQKVEVLAQAGIRGVAIVRFTAELSRWDPGDVRAPRAGGVARRVGGVGRRELPVRARSGRHLRRPAKPRRHVPVQGREDRPHQRPRCRRVEHAGAQAARRGQGGRGRRPAGPPLLHRRRGGRGGPTRAAARVSRRRTCEPTTRWCRRTASTRRSRGRRTGSIRRSRTSACGRRSTAGERPASRRTCCAGGRDLYGAQLRLYFVQRLRDEQAFASADALRARIERDCREARALFGQLSV